MPVPQNLRVQLQKLDQQIVDLLGERVNLCQKAIEEDENVFDESAQAEIVADWEGAADEHGMHVGTVSAIARLVLKLCKVSAE